MTCRGFASASAIVFLLCSTLAAQGKGNTATTFSRVRCLDTRATGVLRDALSRSATVRRLAERLEESDLVVYVRTASLGSDLAAVTRFLSATPQNRFLVVTINPNCAPVDLLPRLGHELRHAVEIAEARDVRDDGALRELFRRIGWRAGGADRWETSEAIAAGHRVALEMWERPTKAGDLARADHLIPPAAK